MLKVLITDEYRKLNREMHERKKGYGSNGKKLAPVVLGLIRKYKIRSILDYGSGKGSFKVALKPQVDIPIYQYEPAFHIDERMPCDLVVCRDVLEHIEPDCIDNVLEDIRELTLRCFYASISTKPSADILADGTNAHRLQRKPEWWKEKIEGHFKIIEMDTQSKVFNVEAI